MLEFAGLRWEKRRDLVIEVCMAMYLLTYFLPSTLALQHLGMWIGFLTWVFLADKSYLPAAFRQPLLWLWGGFTLLMLATTLWSVNPPVTFDSWRSRFDDQLLVLPQILHIMVRPAARRRLVHLLGWGGALVVACNLGQYARDFWRHGFNLPRDVWFEHRGWGYPIAFYWPFALLMAKLEPPRRILWYAVFALMALMMLLTAARGAWLAMACGLAVWGVYQFSRRQLIRIVLAGLAASVLAAALLPSVMVADRVKVGFYTERTEGTWGPAREMADQRPWTGFGFGDKVFNEEFDRQVDAHPHWFFKKGPTPHSDYFAALFSGGYPGLLSLCALFAGIILCALRRIRLTDGADRDFCLALLASFIGFFAVRGIFETVMWEPLLLYVGVLVGFGLPVVSPINTIQSATR